MKGDMFFYLMTWSWLLVGTLDAAAEDVISDPVSTPRVPEEPASMEDVVEDGCCWLVFGEDMEVITPC